jgi:hypothetical protein
MASVEGAVRIKRVGKFFLFGGLAFVVLGAITLLLHGLLPTALSQLGFLLLIYFGILPMILGGSLWAGGWILEGFLVPRGQSDPHL